MSEEDDVLLAEVCAREGVDRVHKHSRPELLERSLIGEEDPALTVAELAREARSFANEERVPGSPRNALDRQLIRRFGGQVS